MRMLRFFVYDDFVRAGNLEVIASKAIAGLGLHHSAAPFQVCLKIIRVSHIRGYEFREPPPQIEQQGRGQSAFAIADEIPLTVRQAAVFLGVSPQTVYLWVERKQIPHLRVMGRNIWFLKSELGPFRATFSHEVGYGKTCKHDGAVFKRNDGKILWITYRNREGKRIRESTFTEDWQEAQRKLRERLQARDDKLLEIVRKGEQLQLSTWVDFFLENYS
jgi:excisionase family DNA binding protein